MIARMWRGWVRSEQAIAYVAYITGTGLREYAATPGNLGCQMWTRDLGDGRTEVLTVSWWESRDAIIGFAGSDIDAAVFYPEDDDTSSIAKPRSHISSGCRDRLICRWEPPARTATLKPHAAPFPAGDS